MRTSSGNFVPVRRKSVYVPPSIRDGYEVQDGEPEPVIVGQHLVYVAGCGDYDIWLYPIGLRGLLPALADWNRGVAWEMRPVVRYELSWAESNIAWRRATRESVKPRTTPRNGNQG